jgi:epoxyqueuosine reductase
MAPTREERVKSAALDVGFSLVGIAAVTPHHRSNDVFERWLAAGMHGGMSWLSRHGEKRRDASTLLDGARSAVCVGLNYYQDTEKEQRTADGSDGRGLFSIYVHGRDYHDVMEEMLERLDRRLKQWFPDMRSLACVDTKPISDRSMAIRAGIAWLGKNASVISPRYGSWIFLGELLTDLELDPDRPLETLCGKCTKCIESCPTGALNEPFVVDARKCISYLTIEERGDIPPHLRGRIGVNVYGCDTCQSVCPFNGAAKQSQVFDRRDRSPLIDMPVAELEQLRDREFTEKTVGSAIRRAKASGIRRNAGIVRENIEAKDRSRPRSGGVRKK